MTATRRGTEEERREEILRAAYAVATRERLAGVTGRAVAAEAGVSSGLVFFYFESVDGLLTALLDWLLARTIVAGEISGIFDVADPAERMMAVIGRDVERLPRQRERVELFFDYWVLGTRSPEIQTRTVQTGRPMNELGCVKTDPGAGWARRRPDRRESLLWSRRQGRGYHSEPDRRSAQRGRCRAPDLRGSR